jgi:hypothetical protein
MRFVIYTLNNCKVCTQRDELHNAISEGLRQMGVETLGIMYGQVNGNNYYPYPEHDTLCRKNGAGSNYVAPVYILEDDNNVIKMPDPAQYQGAEGYVNYVDSVLQQLSEG